MHLYRLASYKTLLLILYQVLFLQTTLQSSLQRRSTDDLSARSRDSHTSSSSDVSLIDSPFIVLMAEDTVSVAQMPMILYGNLTDLYQLEAGDLKIQDIDFHDHSEECDEDGRDLEIEYEDSRERNKTNTAHENNTIADAREYEQMPRTTNTSLGKSEWQQIAVGAGDPEEVFLRAKQQQQQQQQQQSAAANRKDAQEGATNGFANFRPREGEEKEDADQQAKKQLPAVEQATSERRRRRRRSNSLSDYDDDSNSNASRTSASERESHASNSAASTSRSNSHGSAAEESSDMQNVTSAQFDVEKNQQRERQQEANLNSPRGGDSPAEDDDKTGRSPYPSSSLPTSTTSSRPRSLPSKSRVRFTDFDVHMALGYAFVADSAGRIHRFRLPSGPQSSSPGSGRALRSNDIGVGGENVVVENDATANIIDAGSKFGYNSRQTQKDGNAEDGSRVQGSNFNSSHESVPSSSDANRAVDDDDGYTNRIRQRTTNSQSFSNALLGRSARQRESDGATHEQTENERQHPLVSGEQNALSNSADSLVSGPNAGLSQGETLASDKVKQKIIWSRGRSLREGRQPTETSASSAKQKEQQISVANNSGRASPAEARDGNHQLPDAKQTTTSGARRQSDVSVNGGGGGGGEQQRVHVSHGDRDERRRFSERQQSSCATTRGATTIQEERTRQSMLRTEVAIDWLNNLLFVLDRCRLMVMDLDGNNELVLIDDFNANNRPIDIKVDPVNGFLFWLQTGKFHNTIYKLDLGVLSVSSADGNLIINTVKLRHSARTNAPTNDSGNFDASELVPLVSHHYAHPIITNLPKHTKIFIVDHKDSRIYVPLFPSQPQAWTASTTSNDSNEGGQITRDDAEVFDSATSDVTHLNSTSLVPDETANCSRVDVGAGLTEGQILAYNLDGTDVGPFRTPGESSHLSSFEDMQDLTLDSATGLLYCLTNNGRDLFEEFKENSTIQPAQHYLNGKSYSKLLYFDSDNSNQPTNRKPRINVRKTMHKLQKSISANRPTRSDGNEATEEDPRSSSFRISDVDASKFSRNAPYIILGITCVSVATIYLIYSLIFQRIQRNSRETDSHCRHSGARSSMSGGSSDGSDSHIDTNSNRFVNSTTIAKWVAGPSGCDDLDASTFDRNANSFNEYDLSSTNYDGNNAVVEHYRDGQHNQVSNHMFDDPAVSCLANLSRWPTNMHDLSNRQYVPIEVSQDDELNSIRRVSLEQLEIENKEPLGEGHFGMVLQGLIKCTTQEKYFLLDKSQMPMTCNGPISPDSLAPPSQIKLFAPSTVCSSGHGSSSSTSCEFATANALTEPTTSNDDYLTPKTHLNSTSSDYSVDMLAGSSRGASYSGYRDAQLARHSVASSLSSGNTETKFRVAIKKLKDDASAQRKREFLQEAKLLAAFDHPNIVHLIGICLDGGSTLIIMELMLGGDLICYMKANTPRHMGDAENLTYDDLLKICLDIANGCCYLEDRQYVHRDLAARNCLVSSRKREERVVKLADFGLARDIYGDSYYKKVNDSEMPLKWMAPECLTEQKFSTKSDVWSFGIVMWEVMGYCQEKPHANVPTSILKLVLSSEAANLKQPDGCDDCMYKLMKRCWQLEPKERPTFQECRAILIELKNKQRL